MIRTPSEHQAEYVDNILEQLFKRDCHEDVEQSAVYSDIRFHCIQEPETSHGIVLTSQCDIKTSTPENYVLVARLAPVAEIFTYWLEAKNTFTDDEISGDVPIAKDKSKRNGVIKNFTKKYLHNETFAYYYLPALDGTLPHSFVCCEITECVAIKHLKPENKMCVLRSPFREAVPSHYSAYIGRIGTPRYRDNFLTEMLNRICKLRDN